LKLFKEWGKEGGIKENEMMEGVNSTMIYLVYYKNFYKCHNGPLAQPFKKLKINKEIRRKQMKKFSVRK
jgi:hypothetical protein